MLEPLESKVLAIGSYSHPITESLSRILLWAFLAPIDICHRSTTAVSSFLVSHADSRTNHIPSYLTELFLPSAFPGTLVSGIPPGPYCLLKSIESWSDPFPSARAERCAMAYAGSNYLVDYLFVCCSCYRCHCFCAHDFKDGTVSH